MKQSIAYLVLICLSFATLAQVNKPISYSTASGFKKTKPLREIEPTPLLNRNGELKEVHNKRRRQAYINENALPEGHDPLWQNKQGATVATSPIQNWDGITQSEGGATPPDPSGAVGPNHYIQMVNTAYEIFDKQGNSLYGPSSLGSIWGNNINDGDPIVLYDKFADRWFLSQFEVNFFGGTNKLLIAISETSDPLGAYYTYEFDMTSLPDYPKYSVWSDGYYVTANKSGENCFVLERDKMIDGDPLAQIVSFTIPQLNTGGFHSVLPGHASSTLPTVGTPNYLFYYQDDAWGGISEDHLKIWEVSVDWITISNSTISNPTEILVSPFDSQFESSWNDIEQPGTAQKLDAIPGALMYMAQYREFQCHNSVVFNHTVDVDGTNHAGVRWYELREINGTWSLYQEGTYAPDDENRWCGSICMDFQGNIGLAYSVSGSVIYPSIRYTGRLVDDPIGQMTIAEEVIVDGTSVQGGGNNRFGDYAQMTIDPTDDATFWHTGEYITTGGWRARIASFYLANGIKSPCIINSVEEENLSIEMFEIIPKGGNVYEVNIDMKETMYTIELFNSLGQLVESTVTYSKRTVVDLEGKNSGYYLLKVSSANDSKTEKLLIK
ncbi:MAG: T9SS type A sorting domain-containing protein [Flavobacteriales bacterium]|nr:T9SS type A sorting domain-containing protein [Flavobacteriales bacterium]